MPRTSRKFVAVVVWATLCPSFVGVRVLAQAPDPVIAKLQKPISLAAGALSIELGDAVSETTHWRSFRPKVENGPPYP